MALQTSGQISLLDVQNTFGGANEIGMNEYYGVDAGVPGSGQISLSQFYGRSHVLNASYTNNIVAYSIPSGIGGIGEGYWRTAADWYNGTDRQGTVRLWGSVGVGSARSYGTKITGYAVYVDGSAVAYYPATFGGPAFYGWDVIAYVSRGSYVYLSVYAWGAFGSDRVKSGSFYVGTS